MLLAIDCGNTQTVFGLFDGAELTEQFRVGTDRNHTGDEIAVMLRAFVDLSTLDGIVTAPAAELEKQYTGTMLVVRPKIRLDSRSSEMTEARERNWFWGDVMRHTPVYIEVVLAAPVAS